jgi:signal transduction histidine kinase
VPTSWSAKRSSSRRGLLSLAGVDRATVGAVAALKVLNLAQATLVIVFSRDLVRRVPLEVLAAAAVAVAGAVVVWTGYRAQRLVSWAVAADVAIATVVLLISPLFQPVDHLKLWTEWPFLVTFLVVAEGAACFRPFIAIGSTLLVMAAAASWLLASPPPATRAGVAGSLLPYAGFAVVTYVFMYYLRQLAVLADTRALTIQTLEDERMRRVLHTPYRLLNDLAAMLREEAVREGEDSLRQARLAEAVASVQEIESVVRGTEPASGNLAADLYRLQDQFVDLPLLMDLNDATASLPPDAVYRIREAVRSALQNVRLHAAAGQVVVYAATGPSGWIVSVHDDGSGFPAGARAGVGTRDLMVTALEQIGATVEITSSPGQGTFIEFGGGYECSTQTGRA